MNRIDIEITGKTPLLMNSPKSMLDEAYGEKKVKKANKKYDLKEDLEKACYKTKKGKLYIPAEAIKGCMINASAYKKVGKFALKPLVAGGTIIEPAEVILLNKKGKPLAKYDTDLRTVVVQRARIVRARPKVENWKAKFTLVYNDSQFPSPELFKDLLNEGGERIGLLDFRPQKCGSFGQFEVTKFVNGR